MKVAVSIPDPVFTKAELLAKRLKTTRSSLYARALNAYLDEHDGDSVTARINEVLETIGKDELEQDLVFVRAAGRKILERTEW